MWPNKSCLFQSETKLLVLWLQSKSSPSLYSLQCWGWLKRKQTPRKWFEYGEPLKHLQVTGNTYLKLILLLQNKRVYAVRGKRTPQSQTASMVIIMLPSTNMHHYIQYCKLITACLIMIWRWHKGVCALEMTKSHTFKSQHCLFVQYLSMSKDTQPPTAPGPVL